MATAKSFPSNLFKGSEGISEFFCSPCSKDGANIDAVCQCLDCNEYYCVKCIDFHKKFNATSDHEVLSGNEMRHVEISNLKKPLLQLCREHGGDRFAIYCVDHDEVCCNTGVSENHKNCERTTYIVKAAAGIISSPQLQTTRTSLRLTLKEVKLGRSSRQSYLKASENDLASNTQQVQNYSERLIQRIRQLEKASIREINSKQRVLSASFGREIASLDNAISTMEGDLQKLDRSHGNDEAHVFVDVKLSQSHMAEGRKILQQLSRHREPSMKFLYKPDIEQSLNELVSLGKFVDDSRIFKAKLKGNCNANVKQDKETCDITGSCQLPDGTMVITDWNNKRLKRLDASYRVTDLCNMPAWPYGVSCTAPDEVAVTMTTEKKVQFVSVRGTMSLSTSFSTNSRCRGVLYSGGQLYVACGGLDVKDGPGQVVIYTIKGVALSKIQTDATGTKIFHLPYHITASFDGDHVYVADNDRVTVLDRNGSFVGAITDPKLTKAMGLCTLDNGHILVCDYKSNNVLQFRGDGKKMTELLNDNDSLMFPKSLCYDRFKSRLVVTMEDTSRFKLFDLN